VKFSKDGFHHDIAGSTRTRVWYLILADCRLEFYDAHPPLIFYNVTMKNCGGECGDSHLPADEHGLFTVHIVLLLIMIGYFVFYIKLLAGQKKTLGQIHLVAVLLGLAAVLQTISVFMETMHLWVYRSDGKGLRFRHTIFAADLFSEITQGLSELVITIILVSIASGWTLTNDIDMMGNSVSDGGDASGGVLATLRTPSKLMSKVTPANIFITILCIVQVTLEVMGRGYDDDFSSFHDHEHWPGFILMALRICMCIVFHLGIQSTKKGATDAVKQFLMELQITGTLWFIAFPVLVGLSNFLAAYNRHTFVTGGSIVSQVTALGYMTNLFLTRSAYCKVSSLSRMGTISATGSLSTSNSKIAMD